MNYCLRWIQKVPTGHNHWYVRRLGADLQFAGYVHLRTTDSQENRSFDGNLPRSTWNEIAILIRKLEAPEELERQVELSSERAGSIVRGTAGDGVPIAVCEPDDESDRNIAFSEIIHILYPIVSAAAKI